MSEKWIEISIKVPGDLAGMVKTYLSELGSVGVAEDSLGDEEDGPAALPVVKGYFRSGTGPIDAVIRSMKSFVSSLREIFPDERVGEVEVRETGEEDWNGWKKFFKPTRVSRRVVVKPSWEDYSPEAEDVVVEIDPGMAFGTGTHATTRMCIKFLDEAIRGGEDVLDVGTGSGVLAVTAAKLGAERVVAIDNDVKAVKVAGDNVAKNGVDNVVAVSSLPLEDVEGKFDVAVANILAEDLVEMRREIVERLKKGGTLVLSGIIVEKIGLVSNAYLREGLRMEKTLEEGRWRTLMFVGTPKAG